jgi:hypothetical protein
MERDKKREVTKVSCGVIVSGQEMATADIALFSRFIFLSYSKSQFSQEAKEKFAKMAAIRKLGCSHLVLEILQCRALFEAEFRGNYNEAFEDIINALGQSNIEDRIIRNWVIPLAALRTLQDALRLPFTYNDLLKVSIDGIIAQNGETLSNNELNIFWDIVSFLRQEGKIWLGGDYRIELENRIKCTNHKYEIEFPAAKKILYLRHTRIFQLYKMHGRYVNEALLPPASLQHYLENSDAYIGRKQSIRFKNIVNGVQTRIEVIEKGQVTTRPVTAVDQALVFDYDLLVNQFGLNLEEFAS